jgi:hypothetical protein
MTVREAVDRINGTIARWIMAICWPSKTRTERHGAEREIHLPAGADQDCPAAPHHHRRQLADLQTYCRAMWDDSIKLEQMWFAGELDDYIDIEEEELEIARLQPWRGGPAIFAADGLFGFGAHLEAP